MYHYTILEALLYLHFVAFSQSMGIKDGESQAISFDKIEANPTVASENFKFPGE